MVVKARKHYTFVLNFGYAESAMLAYMPWTSRKIYKDDKEALLGLAIFLRDQYLAGRAQSLKKCCAETKIKDPEAKYCSRCGAARAEEMFDGEDFSNWLCQLNTDTDTFHGLIEWDPDHRWQAGILEGTHNQRFVYQAELVLAAAIGHPLRPDRTFESICEDRTRSPADGFCYY